MRAAQLLTTITNSKQQLLNRTPENLVSIPRSVVDMPSPTKIVLAFIDAIPNHKLEGGMRNRGTVWQDYSEQNFRLDNQETITREGEPIMYNIQVQVNSQCTKSTFQKANVLGKSFAWILAPAEEPWSAAMIRDELKASATGRPLLRPGNKLQC